MAFIEGLRRSPGLGKVPLLKEHERTVASLLKVLSHFMAFFLLLFESGIFVCSL